MTLRRVILAALAAAAFGYAGAAQRPAAGDDAMQVLQWVMRANEYLRFGRSLAEAASAYLGRVQDAAATASTLLAMAERASGADAGAVELPRLACVEEAPCVPGGGLVPGTVLKLCSVDRRSVDRDLVVRRAVCWNGSVLPGFTVGNMPVPSPEFWKATSRKLVRVTM